MSEDFTIKMQEFSGPMELLLHLVEKRKLFINDIALADVTDEYVQFLESSEGVSLKDRTQFVLVASTLLLIKSRSLLPKMDLTTEEEEDIEDLEKRLRLYKIYRDAAVHLHKIFGKEMLYSQKQQPVRDIIFTPSSQISEQTLFETVMQVIKTFPQDVTKKVTAHIEKVMSLEEMMEHLSIRIARNIKITFNALIADKKNKQESVVSFLALLELTKKGDITLTQEKDFGDIQIESEKTGVPNYG